jgi:hypothetical protein
MHYTLLGVRVERRTDPADFLAEAMPLFLADEARYNLMLGIAGTLRDQPEAYATFRLWLAVDGSRVVAAALRTPPHNLVLSGEGEGAEALADALADEEVELPGVTGAVPEVDRFVERWRTRTGAGAVERMRQRIYALEQLAQPAGVTGSAREASGADRALLVEWIGAFAAESLPGTSPTVVDAERTVDLRLRSGRGGFMLWEDGEAVSLAGWGGPTPNGIRIGPVYTPPEHRRRGYGSAVTAAASERNLEAGRRFCFLYTDLANPTSNRIYMDIGYEPVCDSVDYGFES